ncbi:MAG: helix-turn-helix domain-containing protein [Gemmataceae bacterium]|nr:helix-turn-helix domain-containing protein [Gemmataceae bacterium]
MHSGTGGALARGTGATPFPGFRSLRTHDFDELAAALDRWDARFEQLGPGPFAGEFQAVQLGGLVVQRIAANRAIQARGGLPRGGRAFTPVQAGNAAAVWRGRRLAPGRLNVLAAGQEMDHLTPAAGSEVLSVLVLDAGRLAAACQTLGGFDVEDVLGDPVALRVDPAAGGKLAVALRGVLRAAATGGGWPRVADDCLLQLVRVLGTAAGAADPGTAAGRAAVVRRAEEYVRARDAMPVPVLDVCRELGVSERTLHYAFREVVGMGPAAYFRAKRLNAARRDLRAGGPRAVSVGSVAARWGFVHLGEFAAQYRRLFGERPSAALGSVAGRRRLTMLTGAS